MKKKSPLLESLHNTAKGLHEDGLITKQRMKYYDALYLQETPSYTAETIKAIRDRLRISQAVLASLLGTSLSTVQKWESGAKHPSGPSKRLLSLIDKKGLDLFL